MGLEEPGFRGVLFMVDHQNLWVCMDGFAVKCSTMPNDVQILHSHMAGACQL